MKWKLTYERIRETLINLDYFIGSVISELTIELCQDLDLNVMLKIDESKVKYKLLIDNKQFEKLNYLEEMMSGISYSSASKYAVGTLMHEAYHLALNHPLEIDSYDDKEVAGLAMDIYINLAIGRDYFIPKEVANQLPSFYYMFYEDMVNYIPGLMDNGSVEYYYKELIGLKKSLEDKKEQSGLSEEEQQILDAMTGDGNESGESDNKNKSNPMSSNGRNDWGSDIESEMNDAQTSAVKEYAEDLMLKNKDSFEDSMMNRGTIGNDIKTRINALANSRKSTMDWKRAIKLFVASVVSDRRKTTRSRKSRRFEGEPGFRSIAVPKLLIGIDTSASVCNKSIAVMFDEINKLWKATERCLDITIVECDTQISPSGIYPYKGITPSHVTGRGGTEFQPVLDKARELRINNIIYLTDGECTAPKMYAGQKILWLIHNNYRSEYFNELPGIKAYIEDKI